MADCTDGTNTATGVAATWQASADLYRQSWEPVTGLFVGPLLEAAGIRKGDRVLDLACGAGAVSAAAAGRGAALFGIDASGAMARIASRRVAEGRFLVGDAVAPPLAAASFDRVVINFGLHHFAEPTRALERLLTALRPGGRLLYTTWAAEEENRALESIDVVYEQFLGEADDPRRDELDFPYGDRERCHEALAGVGFEAGSVQLDVMSDAWRPPTEESVFLAELQGGGGKCEQLQVQSPERLEQICEAVCRKVSSFRTADGIAIPVTAYVVSAARGEHVV